MRRKSNFIKNNKTHDQLIKVFTWLSIFFSILIVVLLYILINLEDIQKVVKNIKTTSTPYNDPVLATMVYNTMAALYLKNNTPTPTQPLPPIILSPTATDTPFITGIPVTIMTITGVPTLTTIPAVNLLTPEDGSQLADKGFVRFSWEPVLGAASYSLEITSPTGDVTPYYTIYPLYDRYLESMPKAGTYTWEVIVKDKKGNVINNGGPFHFTKPQTTPQPTPG